MVKIKAAVAVLLLSSVVSFASETGLRPIEEALSQGRVRILQFNAEREAEVTAQDALFHPENWNALPPPDAKTIAWLSSRIPNLDVKNLRAVPLEIADTAMQRAVTAKATYLDLFTNGAFRTPNAYYVSQEALVALHVKYISGSLPVQGADEHGKPFQMQALVIGQNKVQILYDRDEFIFKDAKNKFKVQNRGRVESGILGAGDVSIDGLSAYGAPVVCPWAKVKRMTKESMYKVKVETSCGSRGGNDLHEIRPR